ncbi:putative universal stress protein PHOS32 [Cocos nucifera]|uniref:Putative universal stress protein PHOS32 n=1 Tax=Cocos nucifera TaxID=13894 RepID=A0A8K0N2B2_COCNU|nr:putative universal stress protein PHOS32 [Cocos nucifera]
MRGRDGRRLGSKSSKRVMGWIIDNLLNYNNALIVLHVMHPKGDEAKHSLWSQSGSAMIPLMKWRQSKVMKNYDLKVDIEAFHSSSIDI